MVQTDQGVWHAPIGRARPGRKHRCRGARAGSAACPPASPRSPRPTTATRAELPDGGVLVVGASASGIQIAAELHRSGRPVTLAVGEHVRMPRTYRGKDILWWMDAAGLLDERYDQIPDLIRARNLPSMQLVGSPGANHPRPEFAESTRRAVGRTVGRHRDGIAQFSGSLPNMFALADLKLGRLLDTIDAWATEAGLDGGDPPRRFAATAVPAHTPLTLDLRSGAVRTILWATGFRPDLSWLDVPVLRPKRPCPPRRRHHRSPGLYLMGMPFLRRRKSTLIDGAAADATDLSEHLTHYLDSN